MTDALRTAFAEFCWLEDADEHGTDHCEACAARIASRAASETVDARQDAIVSRKALRNLMQRFPDEPVWGRLYLIACGLLKPARAKGVAA